jgi:hypothetical protein
MNDGFTLQSTGTLQPPNWQNVSQPPAVNNGQYQVTLPLGAGGTYFRLQH